MSRKIIVQEFITADGIMQAPGTKEEDTRNDFTEGGWQLPYYDETLVKFMIDSNQSSDALLLGARTFKTFASYWPTALDDGNPFVPEMNRLVKYVVSNNTVDLSWANSVQIKGNIISELKKLKNTDGKDITIIGSGKLVQSLIPHHLIDEYILIIAPLKLGKGTKIFESDGIQQKLTLKDCIKTSSGELIITYKTT